MDAARRAVGQVPPPAGLIRFGRVEISEVELKGLNDFALRERLIAGGISRLSAERIVAIERGKAECGRARPHRQAHR
jgi:hypothetical protein